jgi:hypothetical protein
LPTSILAWLEAFAFTQLVEVPVYMRGLGCSPWRAFGASALTHPVVWFLFGHPGLPGPYWARVAAAEVFACLAEAAYFRRWGARRALGWSLVANAASLALGLASRALFGFGQP